MQRDFLSAFFAEIVDAKGGGQAAVFAAADGGANQDDCGDDKGKCLVKLSGNHSQPAENSRESGSQRTAGHPQGIEETKNKGADNGKGGIPVGKDDQCYGNPAVAVDPAAGVEGTGHIQSHIVAANAHDAAAQADVQILGTDHIDANGVSGTGIFTHGSELQTGGGVV